MSGLAIMLIALVFLGGGYLFYGRHLANKWGIDPKAKTPAYEINDGVDYVPSDKSVVFGHQFASIAGAGPINGPIVAAMFGWVPVLLWILVGGVFFGAVQDFAAMYASVKNKGKTIGYIIEQYIGKAGKKLFLAFTWLFSILVVAAFADVVAQTFNGFTKTVTDGVETVANSIAGGQVASTSMFFIVAAVGLGLFLKHTKFSTGLNTVIAIALLVICVVLGMTFPLFLTADSWHLLVFFYIFIASVVPVWILLQPRDYLNSFLLVFMIAAAVVGIIVYNPSMNLNAFNGFVVNGKSMFPFLFVTIACGAVSGFHALVSSGTASKQIKNEKDMLPVSFGAMLVECLLAVVALVAVGFMASNGNMPQGTPAVIFANAIATFTELLGIPYGLATTLITLSVSAFALTSLDSVARVGRLAFQEFWLEAEVDEKDLPPFKRFMANKYFATLATLLVAYFLAKVGYKEIWALFGSANQLLSALSLIACAVFLKSTNRNGKYLWVPMVIMLIVTLSALTLSIYGNVQTFINGTSTNIVGDVLQFVFGIALFVLGVNVAYQGIKKLASKKGNKVVA